MPGPSHPGDDAALGGDGRHKHDPLYLAGLQGSPGLCEAADVDGASGWDRFRHITLPAAKPTTFFIFITSVIGGFQRRPTRPYIMTRGGLMARPTISYSIFSHAFEWFNMGYAAAIAVVLFGLVLVVTLINWRYGESGSTMSSLSRTTSPAPGARAPLISS